MGKIKQVWEYPTITGSVYGLLDKFPEESARYLVIGTGIILGSNEAYDEQRDNYGVNRKVDLARESGMIAEEIVRLAGSRVWLEELEEVRRITNDWDQVRERVCGILRKRRHYDERDLRELGKQVEEGFRNQDSFEGLEKLAEDLSKGQLKGQERLRKMVEYQRRKGEWLVKENIALQKYVKGGN